MAHHHGNNHAAHDGTAHDGTAHGHANLNWGVMAPFLERKAELAEPWHTQAARWVGERLPSPRRILDLGSGPGVVTTLFAQLFPTAEAVAVDAAEVLLERARERAERAGVADRFRTVCTELPDGCDALGKADLIWMGQSLHHIGDQRAALTAFAGLLEPGGVIALVEGGLPTRCLPRDIGFGRPGLQFRIDAAVDGWFTGMRASLPGTKDETEDWSALLADAGLTPTGSRTFLLDLPAPLSTTARDQVVANFEHYRKLLDDGLDADDLATLDRLLDPADDRSLHHRPDVFLLDAMTVHTATRE